MKTERAIKYGAEMANYVNEKIMTKEEALVEINEKFGWNGGSFFDDTLLASCREEFEKKLAV